MTYANLRAGAYALLAISLINAVYQSGDRAVSATSAVCVVAATIVLVASARDRGRALLAHRPVLTAAWLVVIAGTIANVLR